MKRKRVTATPAIRHRNLPLLLLQAREAIMTRFRPIMNAHGITEQQWRIARLLLEAGPLEPREITAQCQISSPSLVGILTRMEQDGLVVRKPFEGDKRRLLVYPAERAQMLAAAMAPEIDAAYLELQQLFGKQFYQQLFQSLDHIVATMDHENTN